MIFPVTVQIFHRRDRRALPELLERRVVRGDADRIRAVQIARQHHSRRGGLVEVWVKGRHVVSEMPMLLTIGLDREIGEWA